MHAHKSSRQGQFQEKEKNSDCWIDYFPFEFFSTEEKQVHMGWITRLRYNSFYLYLNYNRQRYIGKF